MMEFWNPIIDILDRLGMDKPEHIPSFIALGRINKEEVICNELAGIMSIAWRCLYAAITESRKEDNPLNLEKAYDRTIRMAHTRYVSNAEGWKEWAQNTTHQTKRKIIPMRHQEKVVFHQEPPGDYTIASVITSEIVKLNNSS